MRCIVMVLVLSLGLCLPIAAQSVPVAEVFGGYQFTRLEGGINANGWNASVTGNANRWFGLAGDFSGVYKSIGGVNANVYTYTFGPVVSLNHEGTVNPFVHGLFGGAHLGASISGVGSGSTNGFVMMFGGGADAKVRRRFAVRVIQADWVYYRFSGVSSSKNVRISSGIVVRF
jgi:hypothetical protein